jgi:hypothetical protein
LARSFTQSNDFRVRRRITVCASSISRDSQQRLAGNDARTNRNFVAPSSFPRCFHGPVHPACVDL